MIRHWMVAAAIATIGGPAAVGPPAGPPDRVQRDDDVREPAPERGPRLGRLRDRRERAPDDMAPGLVAQRLDLSIHRVELLLARLRQARERLAGGEPMADVAAGSLGPEVLSLLRHPAWSRFVPEEAPGPDAGPRPFEPLADEEIDALADWAASAFPEFDRMRQRNPEVARVIIARMGPRLAWARRAGDDAERSDEARLQLDRVSRMFKIATLAAEARLAQDDPDERQRIRRQLRGLATEHFDEVVGHTRDRAAELRAEAARLNAQADEIDARLDLELAERDRRIDQVTEDLLASRREPGPRPGGPERRGPRER